MYKFMNVHISSICLKMNEGIQLVNMRQQEAQKLCTSNIPKLPENWKAIMWIIKPWHIFAII